MKGVKGIKITELGFIPQKIGDLIYHEGPLLSAYNDRNNPDTYYLYKWADCDEKVNRWLVSQVSISNLRSFFLKEISLRTLVLSNPSVFILELDDKLMESGIMISATTDLPNEYMPKESSFYKEDAFTDFSQTFKTRILGKNITETLTFIINEVNSIKLILQRNLA